MGWIEDAQERMTLMALIVDRFALLEYTLRETLTLLMSADPVVAHVFATQAAASEMVTRSEQILEESARKKIERGSPELREALRATRLAFGRRNDLLHNLTLQWAGEDGRDVAMIRKPRRGQDRPMLIPAQLDDLRAIYDEANAAINALTVHQPHPPFEMPEPY